MNDPEASQEYNSDAVGTIDTKSVIGQTFISRRPNINGITIWVTVTSDQENTFVNANNKVINITLFHTPMDVSPVFSTSILAPTSGKITPLTIKVPNQNNPAEESYYIQLTTNSNTIILNGRNEDVYPHGQVYINDQPINADIAFRLSYDYDFAALAQDLWQVLMNIWLVFPLIIILWLPGWLLLEFSGLRIRFDYGEQAALSIGISLALIPIIMLWTTVLNIRWTRSALLFIAGFLVALFFVRIIYNNLIPRSTNQKDYSHSGELQNPPQEATKFRFAIPIILVLIFLFTLAIRLVMVRDLATPAWVDSVHHALITRTILSLGSYPSSYEPYFDIDRTAYHPGFHSIVASFSWVSNLSIDQSLLIIGQVLNATAVLSVYLFTKILTQSSSAGLFAAIITGFLTPMPAYYTSWGRYTELTGLLILPAAFALFLLLIKGNISERKYWIIFLSAVTSGGLFMVHYRVTAFLACLILSYLLIYVLIKNKKLSVNTLWVLRFILIIVISSVMLVFPWMFQTIKNVILPIIKSTEISSVPLFRDFSWAYLTSGYGKQTLVIAGLGLISGMVERKRFVYLLLVWIFLLFLIANLDALHITGNVLINNSSVVIMLFIPISILGGYFINQIIRYWKDLIPIGLEIPFQVTILIMTVLVAYIGSKQLITIINPITILSRNADLPAIDWVQENIPRGEKIVINPFAWGYGLFAGSDGGYWISPLSGRVTLPPPVLYGLESDIQQVNEKIQQIIDLSSNPLDLWKYLNANQIQYIYIGAKGGILSPEQLSGSQLFSVLYHIDGVWIFRLKPLD
jgi:hypothetical protein